MVRASRLYSLLGLGFIAALAAFLAPFATPGDDIDTAHAGGEPQSVDCVDLGEILCISLDPEQDTNTVGDDHTVTAALALTVKGEPAPADFSGIPIVILVFDGPNAGDVVTAASDANGQLALTYAGDGGPGTDNIAALACLPLKKPQGDGVSPFGDPGDPCDFAGFISFCLGAPVGCLETLIEPDGVCAKVAIFICDVAAKEWVEPAPTPTPTQEPEEPTPTGVPPIASPTAEVVADIVLPDTGAGPGDGGPVTLAWLAAIAGAIAALAAGGLWVANQRRRVR